MATPMTADQFVKALKAEGVNVKEYGNWRSHNRNHKGAWGPVNGVVIHHTAGSSSLSLCYNGTSTLPGPLCHTHLAKNGVASMVGNGRANHAGGFTANAHSAVLNESSTHPRPSGAESVDGNRHYYGIEIENLGNGKDPYPAVQYDAAVRWAAAICRHHGWSADSVIGHKEGTTRKIDPTFSMTKFRADVAARLGKKPEPAKPPANDKPATVYVDLSNVVAAAKRDPKLPQGGTTHKTDALRVELALHAEGLLAAAWVDGSFGTKTVGAYAAWQRKCGYRGSAADGIPGSSSLAKLGARHGWKVKA